MRSTIAIALTLFSMSSALGQDPTVPSPAIVERMSSQVAPEPRNTSTPLPTVRLRAIVMANRDQGIAIVDSEGQRLQIRLDRSTLKQAGHTSRPDNFVNRIQIQGVEYGVEDFSHRTIILTDSIRKVFVQ